MESEVAISSPSASASEVLVGAPFMTFSSRSGTSSSLPSGPLRMSKGLCESSLLSATFGKSREELGRARPLCGVLGRVSWFIDASGNWCRGIGAKVDRSGGNRDVCLVGIHRKRIFRRGSKPFADRVVRGDADGNGLRDS